jgi:hypothetical protein
MSATSTSVYDRALRKTDITAFMILLFGVFFVLRGESMVMTKPTGFAMYATSGFGLVVAVLLPMLVRGILKRVPKGEDEYLRKLLRLAAAGGFYFAFAVFVVWAPLTGTLLPDLTAPQLLGVMFVGAALAWFGLRWRDSR